MRVQGRRFQKVLFDVGGHGFIKAEWIKIDHAYHTEAITCK